MDNTYSCHVVAQDEAPIIGNIAGQGADLLLPAAWQIFGNVSAHTQRRGPVEGHSYRARESGGSGPGDLASGEHYVAPRC